MQKEVVSITILLVIMAIAISVLAINFIQANTTEDIEFETHSYAKAICDQTNYCQDYIVRCNKDQVLSINPITGAAVQFPHDWQDPRDEETRNGFCLWS